ncbi:hypothetical protein AVEN_132275-2-1, partial [Araneus ventricosus]
SEQSGVVMWLVLLPAQSMNAGSVAYLSAQLSLMMEGVTNSIGSTKLLVHVGSSGRNSDNEVLCRFYRSFIHVTL